MNNSKEDQEKVILLLIDRFNEEMEKDRVYFLKYHKNNPDSGLQKEPFISFYKVFESKATNSEIFDFLYQFGNIRLIKTFHYSSHSESLNHSFESLKIPIPHFVLECQKEVIHREDFINNYFEKEKFKWIKSQREDFLSKIQKEAKNHSFDHKSEKEYITKKFEETIQEVRKIEKEIKSRFGYLVENFFDGETFNLSKDDLNEYFYHSEISSGGYRSFFEVFKALDQYVSKKNEVFTFRGFLSGQIEVKGLESIWMKNPKKTIDEVIKKGFDLGLWDEKNRLQSKRGGVYGSGKNLLSGLYFSLKGNSIKENIDYKEVGKALCDFFNVSISTNTKEPFKPFQTKMRR